MVLRKGQPYEVPYVGQIANVKGLNFLLSSVTPDSGDYDLSGITDKILCWPWVLGQDFDIDTLGLWVTQAGGQLIRVGIYQFNGGVVGDQVIDTGEIDVSAL